MKIILTILFILLIIPQNAVGEQIKYGSESNNYKYNIMYPKVVGSEQINKITITICNKSNINDKKLTIESRDITKGNGVSRILQDWDKSAFRILKAEPKPNRIEAILGANYFDYSGLKAGETKTILLYFKITHQGYYKQKITFYTDKHGDEEYELLSKITIKCKK